MFQSSPAINCGCHFAPFNPQSTCGGFNPHPRSTAGVTGRSKRVASGSMFQSSPAINCGCHNRGVEVRLVVDHVSILTRDQLRVSPQEFRREAYLQAVSILTRDQLRVSLATGSGGAGGFGVSIHTRDQLRVSLFRLLRARTEDEFQSSPAINCGCHFANQAHGRNR